MNLIYPPYCRHCDCDLRENAVLCTDCIPHLNLFKKEGRCFKCFRRIPMREGTCKPCRNKRHAMRRLAACFDRQGPGRALLNAYLYEHHDPDDLASFIVVQFNKQKWPYPKIITAIPRTFSRPLDRLAKRVASLLKRPFLPLLLADPRRPAAFVIRKKWNIIGESVLLLTDSIYTRDTIRKAAIALDEGIPEHIHGMAICAT